MPRISPRAAAVFTLVYLGRPAAGQVTFSVDPAAGRSAISPLIYGVNPNNVGGVANPGLNQSAYAGLNLTSERLGGDRWTAYNYLTNASNAGSDYLYSNDNYLGGGNTPGGAVLPFLSAAASANASPIVTVPMAGYVSADESGPIATPLPPPQASSHFVPTYPTIAADPAPAAGHVYQNGFVQLVANAFPGTAARPLVFMLDNEPDLWSSSHPEVHPAQTTYAELLSKSIAYATMIKATAPNAMVYGPASYGWDGYQSLQAAPDSAANGNFINYYLSHMAAASATAGTRLLDALDLHWYPEAQGTNGVRIINDDTSPATVAARLQAPRSLWDPTYVENSYITQNLGNKAIDLIPLMQGKIAANYAGTKLSFSEYNYGAGESISGGIAEADVLGIFGKYGVYSADEWPLLGNEQFVAAAFQMFRNYDGHNGAFGDTEVSAANSDAVNASVYASVDSANPDHLTLVLINKSSTATTAAVNLANAGRPESAAAYQMTSASAAPMSAGTIAIANPSGFTYAMPAYSVTTLTMTSDQWLPAVGGSWGAAGSWSGTIPNAAGAHANFLSLPTGLTTSGTVTLDGNRTVGRIVFDDAWSYTLAPGTGGTLTIDDGSAAAPSITVVGGQHTITAPIALAAGATVTTPPGGPANALRFTGGVTGSGTLTVTAGSRLDLSCSVATGLTSAGTTVFTGNTTAAPLVRTVGALSIPAGGVVQLTNGPGRTLLAVASLSVAGKLDLASDDLDVAHGDLAAITAAVRLGFTGTTTVAATGIVSSTSAFDPQPLAAVGILLNGSTYTTFDGLPVAPTDVLARYTYFGDANLDGSVTAADYTRVDAGFVMHLTGWQNGDFNYDGVVDGSDYTLMDNAFNQQVGGIGSPTAVPAAQVATMPEPAGLIGIAAVGLLGPRRRRARCA